MAHVVGSVDLDAMVLAIPKLAELTGIHNDPSKRLAALFLAVPPPPQGELVQLH